LRGVTLGEHSFRLEASREYVGWITFHNDELPLRLNALLARSLRISAQASRRGLSVCRSQVAWRKDRLDCAFGFSVDSGRDRRTGNISYQRYDS
jgi:hypothetical protein